MVCQRLDNTHAILSLKEVYTCSREMSRLSKMSISIFLQRFLKTLKVFILMQTPLQLDIWLQSYEGFDNAKNNMKQRNLNTVVANISKTTSPTSNSFLLIKSHILSVIIKRNKMGQCTQYRSPRGIKTLPPAL